MNPAGGGVSAWPSADAQGDPAVARARGLPGRRRPDRARERRRRRRSRRTRGRALGARRRPPGLPAGAGRRRRDRRRAATAPPVASILTVPRGLDQAVARRRSRGCRRPAPTGRSPTRSCSTGACSPRPPAPSSCDLGARGLGSGRHRVQVLATDLDGAATLSAPSTLLIDGVPPDGHARERTSAARQSACAYATATRASTPTRSASASATAPRARRTHEVPTPLRARRRLPGDRPRARPPRQSRRRAPVGERAMRAASRVIALCLALRDRALAGRAGPARPTCSGRSHSRPRARSKAAKSSRPTTRTTRRSPATDATSRSTARSAGSPACGGATSQRAQIQQVAGGDAELPSISARRSLRQLHHQRRNEPPGDHQRDPRCSPAARSGGRVRTRHGRASDGAMQPDSRVGAQGMCVHGGLRAERLDRAADLRRLLGARPPGRSRSGARRSAPTDARSRS